MSQHKTLISYSFKVLLILLLMRLILTNTPLEIGQDKSIEGKIPTDDGYEFYTITLGENITDNIETLVIKVQEDKGTETEREDFSDVDIYVSLTEEKPKTPGTSTWYSEQFGDDIVTIGKRHITKGAKFHVGVYCQFKCNYKITAYLSEMIEIVAGKIYTYHIEKQSSMSFKIKTKEDFERLSIAVISPFMQPFKLFVSIHNPSSQNTYKVEPSWISGYSFETKKGDSNYYPGEEYKMVVESQEEEVDIRILITYPETITALKPTAQIFDSVKGKEGKCYMFEMNSDIESDSIIINMILFSGASVIKLHGFTPNVNLTYDTIKYDDYTYEITSEKVIIVKPGDLSIMKDNTTNQTEFHFCVYSAKKTSYLIGAHFSSQSELLQRMNFLLMGNSIMGYLPKGQVTKYRILDFTRDSNITISLDTIEGNPKLYAFFTEDFKHNFFQSKRLQNELKDKNPNLLEGYKTLSGYELDIENTNNICHSKLSSNTDFQGELTKLSCGLFAIIYCEPQDDSDVKECTFRIRVSSDKSTQWMAPRTTYYGILSKDEVDEYSFKIEDDSIDGFSIVQNSISGDAGLIVYLVRPELGDQKLYHSHNHYYLPNVIHVTQSNRRPSLAGQYKIQVKANMFSTYSIYYYTKQKTAQEAKPQIDEVELTLLAGHLIQGYFSNTTQYKIYSYSPDSENKEIRITLTKRNFRFSLYVFLDLDNFVLNNNSSDMREIISGYLWKSGYDSQVVIKKTDPNYSKAGPYYIVVAREKKHNNSPEAELEPFTLGVTDEDTALILSEGLQHFVILNENYTYQSYSYAHPNKESPLSFAINLFYGKVNIYIGFKEITLKTVKNYRPNDTYYFLEEEQDSAFITIPKEDLVTNCGNDEYCRLYIFILKKNEKSAQYLITPKSSVNRPIYLTPGFMIQSEIQSKEKHYYIIEQNEPKSANVIVKFRQGSGDIYLKEDNKEENEELLESDFPIEETPSVQKGSDHYQGQIITIKKQSESNFKTKRYLVTVQGRMMGYDSTAIRYTIIYSSETKQINQNNPFKDSINEGELHYYRLYFDDEPSVYISLTPTNGDADLYMNYGEELPTFKDWDWSSSNPLLDYITFDKFDNFFRDNNLGSIKGVYTILVYGYTNSSYTLFATTHPKRIIPISNNNPGTCFCRNETEQCYFRYDNIFPYYLKEITDVSIAFSTNFIYGSGVQYVKLYNETDYDITEHFPSNVDFEWSNTQVNKRNFLKVDIKKTNVNLKLDSMLLITVDCLEKSLVELNSAKITNSSYYYLDERRENLFYLEESKVPTILSFYLGKKRNLNYELYSYTGSANVLVFQNSSSYNPQTNQTEMNYQHLSQFDLERGKSYYNFLNIKNSISNNVYFKVLPKENIGFFVRLVYEADWTRMEVGKTITYQVNDNIFYGFFDIVEEYGDIIMSVKTEDPSIQATFFAKVNIWSRVVGSAEETNKLIKIPSENDNDARGKTDASLGFGALKVKAVQLEEFLKGNIARVYFVVKIRKKNNKELIGLQAISILVSPQQGKIKRVDSSPLTMYFSSEKNLETSTIFDLKKIKKTDDIIVVEISQCQGEVTTSLTSKLTHFVSDYSKVIKIKTIRRRRNGLTSILANGLNESDYHLRVWGSEMPDINCEKIKEENPNAECDTDIQYLLYYFSANSKTYTNNKLGTYIIGEQVGKGKITLTVGGIKERDYYGNNKVLDNVVSNVFISDNEDDFVKMGSLCYLQKMGEKKIKFKASMDPNTKKILVSGLRNGITYFINVVLENPTTGELFTFSPISFELSQMRGGSLLLIFVLVIVITILGFGLCYFYKKFKTTNAILKYEESDISNMGKLPRSSTELSSISASEKIKYTTLTSEVQSV